MGGRPARPEATGPEGWKFHCSPLGEHELYNLKEDPHETTNLATRVEHRARMGELRERLLKWQEQTSDPVALPPV